MTALFNRTGYKTVLSQQRLACLNNCKLVWFQNSSSVVACTGYFESPISWNKCLQDICGHASEHSAVSSDVLPEGLRFYCVKRGWARGERSWKVCGACQKMWISMWCLSENVDQYVVLVRKCGSVFNPLKPKVNPICYLLALLAHHFLHVSRIRVKSLTLR